MNGICIALGFIFLIIAVAFFLEIGPNWIKEWREMKEEERQGVRIGPLSKNIGCVFFSAGIIFICSGFCLSFKDAAFEWCMIAWLVFTGLDIWFISKSNHYKTGL